MIVAINSTAVTIGKAQERKTFGGAWALRRHEIASLRVHGFTYIGLLILISLMGVALAGTGIVQSQQNQRAKEVELLFIGEQFQRAIAAYYERSPGGGKRFPQALEDLLNDTRFPVPQRHLRRIYRDPMTGSTDWGLVHEPDNGISGVFSRSEAAPIKTSFPEKFADFQESRSYAEWKFVYRVTAAVPQSGEDAAQPAPTPSAVK
jgi:type II secretory pathway pseudopilin PulG